MSTIPLAQLQQNFQSYILENNTQLVKNILPSKNLSALQQIQIYQNSYFERIIAALTQDFPVIHAFLGDSAFASLARDYISHYPSHDFNLRFIGKHLSEFLKNKDPIFLAFSDLAKLEYRMCDAEESDNHFHSDFNVIEVYNAFHCEDRLISLEFQAPLSSAST